MDSPSGASSGSSLLPNSSSDGDLQAVMDQRKRKRMLSNRESARRSRMRKQQHLDELTSLILHLRKENGQILTALNITTQHYFGVEAENAVLRTQMMELSHRLQSLNEIMQFISASFVSDAPLASDGDDDIRPWDAVFMSEPIMDSAEMFHYY